MKGILLAGGAGTRLYPLTRVCCKQLLPVFDKPMIYYPLSTLMYGGIRDVLFISTPKDTPILRDFLGDGSSLGMNFSYIVQERPEGIAQAFLLGSDFIGRDNVTLILGDNLFYGKIGFAEVVNSHRDGAVIFGYSVKNPHDFGVIEFNRQGEAVSIEEKPKAPKSRYAVPGLYVYDNDVVQVCQDLRPSSRGELEITDVNMHYLRCGKLRVVPIGRGAAWLDTGTTEALAEAATFLQIVEQRQGLKIGCPEELAARQGFITAEQLDSLIEDLPNCQYRDYLHGVAVELKEQR